MSPELPAAGEVSEPTPAQNPTVPLAGPPSATGSNEFPDFAWHRVFPDSNVGWESNESVAAASSDAEGNVYIAGSYWGTLAMGMGEPLRSTIPEGLSKLPSPTDIFVSKLDKYGQVLWSHSFGDGQSQWATATATDADGGVYIAGGFAGTLRFGQFVLTAPDSGGHAFVAKLRSRDGTAEWAKSLGNGALPGSRQIVTALLNTNRSNLTIIGNFTGTISGRGFFATSAGSKDIFLLNLSSNGEYRWFRRFGGVSNEIPVAAAMAPGERIVIAGYHGKSFSFATTHGSPAGTLSDAGGGNVFLAAFNASGEHIFSKSFGDHRRQELRAMSVSESGKIVIAGPFNGTIDFGLGPLTSYSNTFDYDSSTLFVAAFDTTGGAVWQRTIGQSGHYTKATSIALTHQNEILLSGGYTGLLECKDLTLKNNLDAGTYEQFFLKLTDTGECANLKGIGDAIPWGAENNMRVLYLRSDMNRAVLAYGGSRAPFLFEGGDNSPGSKTTKDSNATIAVLR